MSFKKINYQELCEYKNAFDLFKDWAITMVEHNNFVNPMTIGWGGLGILWRKPCCSVYIHKTRYSKELFDQESYFSVSCYDMSKYKEQLSYFGTISGKNENKTQKSGLTLKYNQGIPYFEEAEVVIFCKKMGQTDMTLEQVYEKNIKEWYDKDGVHTIYFGEIVDIFIKVEE